MLDFSRPSQKGCVYRFECEEHAWIWRRPWRSSRLPKGSGEVNVGGGQVFRGAGEDCSCCKKRDWQCRVVQGR